MRGGGERGVRSGEADERGRGRWVAKRIGREWGMDDGATAKRRGRHKRTATAAR